MSSRKIFTCFATSLLAAAALSQSGCHRAESKALAGDAIYEMDVPDMVCEGCALGITEALEKVKGVEEVQVFVKDKRVRIGVASALLAEEEALAAAVREAGYEVEAFAQDR